MDDHCAVCGKQTINPGSKWIHQNDHHRRTDHTHDHADTHTLSHTVIFTGSEILSHKGSNGNRKCIDHHPEKSIDFPKSSPCRHCVSSQIIYKYLYHNIGNIIHYRFQTCRNTDSQNWKQHSSVKTDLIDLQHIYLSGFQKHYCYNQRTDHLRSNCSNSYSCHTHAKRNHKQQIKNNVQHTGNDQNIQWSFGVSYCTQDGCSHIINQVKNHSAEINMKIHCRVLYYICRCLHKQQCRSGQKNPHYSKNNSRCNGECKCCMQCLTQILLIFCPIKLRDHNCCPWGKPYKKANDQIGDLTGRTSNCSKCLFSYETADNNSICRIINLLKKCSKYNRKEK